MKLFNKFLSENHHLSTSDPDTMGDIDATHSTQLPTRPILHDSFPTYQSVGKYQVIN